MNLLLPTQFMKNHLSFWTKNPSIVFDQGASTVWGQDSIREEKASFDEQFYASSTLFDTEFDFIPSSLDDPFLYNLTNPFKDCEMMSSPDRTRKCSISDIIDVINEEKLLIKNCGSLNNKDEGYDSNLSIGSLSSEEIGQDEFEGKFTTEENSSDDECFINVEDELPVIQDQTTKADLQPQSKVIGNLVSSTGLPKLLSGSNSSAIIVLWNTENKIQIVCTSKKKLHEILQNQNDLPSSCNTTNNAPTNTKSLDPTPTNIKSLDLASTIESKDSGSETEKVENDQAKRRGRKRIYHSNTETEREDSKRVRNNEACRKFRKSRTEKRKSLFQSESTLLQRNLNLKEQVAALERQLLYIKEKLGMSKNISNN
ncbi:uncharacterized protein [Clytia hemisphaerica]|uniref:BZIP domain-containing protein n=1 Tax=Clytia hemisphaerica TaxID=252671 RepID=A0A7M5WW48_9CNID|eukprot:TCONS_00011982-protein